MSAVGLLGTRVQGFLILRRDGADIALGSVAVVGLGGGRYAAGRPGLRCCPIPKHGMQRFSCAFLSSLAAGQIDCRPEMSWQSPGHVRSTGMTRLASLVACRCGCLSPACLRTSEKPDEEYDTQWWSRLWTLVFDLDILVAAVLILSSGWIMML